jgi:ribosome maturation factor RimP
LYLWGVRGADEQIVGHPVEMLIEAPGPFRRNGPKGVTIMSANESPLDRVRVLAERVASSYGLDIFDVELKREGGQQVLRVIVDRPGPAATPEESVSIDDCARVAEELGTMLDVEDVMPGGYTFEVSSPGLDRPLRSADDYRRFAGRWAKIVTSEPVQRQTAFAGRVKGIEGDDVLFESEGKKLVKLPLRLISRARLEVEF